MTTQNERLVLRFRTVDGYLIRFTIPRPAAALTAETITPETVQQTRENMTKLIDLGHLLTSRGTPNHIVSAIVYHTKRKRLVGNN